MAKILIAGCGYVGCELATLLLSQGHVIYAIKRRPENLPAGVNPLALDLVTFQAGSLPLVDIDYVFYLAAADQSSEPSYRHAYYMGLANLIAQLKIQGQRPKRIFFSSSTAVYAQSNGEWVNEDSATEPDNFKGEILLAAEDLLLGAAFPGCVVRFGGIYGPGRWHLLQTVTQAKAKLNATPIYTNRIHLADCAGLLAYLMSYTELKSVYLGVDSEPTLKNEVLLWLAAQLKVALPGLETLPETEPHVRSNKRCSNHRLLQTGYPFRYPNFRLGYLSQI
jgi:nucleoside-diphosphate-sugar epimerase